VSAAAPPSSASPGYMRPGWPGSQNRRRSAADSLSSRTVDGKLLAVCLVRFCGAVAGRSSSRCMAASDSLSPRVASTCAYASLNGRPQIGKFCSLSMACVALSTLAKTTTACAVSFHPEACERHTVPEYQPHHSRMHWQHTRARACVRSAQTKRAGQRPAPPSAETRTTGPNTLKRPSRPCSRSAPGMFESRS